MPTPLVILSLPGLRTQDLEKLPTLAKLSSAGSQSKIQHSFPAVTWPTQCQVLTGALPDQHGVVANGFYWRDEDEVEMWTAWNEKIQMPQIWDVLKQSNPELKTAAWFPMLAKGCNADFVCMPAPIHKPDGSEDMWCHTKPQEFYGELLEQLGHFPLKHFWGPLAGIQSSQWIVDSAIAATKKFQPDVWYIYLPHLDYAAQKNGPNSAEAEKALVELEGVLAHLVEQFQSIYVDSGGSDINWLAISEYVITEVGHVTYPNRMLREADLLVVEENDGREQLSFSSSSAWALVDHQFSHVFVKDHDAATIQKVVELFEGHPGIKRVLAGDDRAALNMQHERSGDVILVSEPNSWQAYYWWLDNAKAPEYAATVDIHQKPGYDPVELFFDMTTMSVPLDATLVKGSHGALVDSPDLQGAVVCSVADLLPSGEVKDTDLFDLILKLATA